MAKKVLRLRQMHDKVQPETITYLDPKGRLKTSDGMQIVRANAAVSAGRKGYSVSRWTEPEFHAIERGQTRIEVWDFYECDGSFGAFSSRALNALSLALGDRFTPLPAKIEGHRYFCLHCRERVDCLDHSKSEIDYYDESDEVMSIWSFVFNRSLLADPMIFAIPELPLQLFCTESVPEVVLTVGLRGFDFIYLDGEDRTGVRNLHDLSD